MKYIIVISLFTILMSLQSCHERQLVYASVDDISAPSEVKAGQEIIIKAASNGIIPNLRISNAIGSTLISAEKENSDYYFEVPPLYCKISGALDWCLDNHCGSINILPLDKVASIESYIGPTTVIAGQQQSYMAVAMAKDIFGNLCPNDVPIILKSNYKGSSDLTQLQIKNGLVYKYGSSGEHIGNKAMTFQGDSMSTTKEYNVEVGPAKALPFKMFSTREHDKADGNSLVSLSTNEIKDEFGNIIANGSLVRFSISGKKSYSYVDAYTIDGKAKCQILHPTKSDVWMLSAQISDSAKSNQITHNFDSALQQLPITINAEKIVNIGPMTSYLGQYIPDGFPIKLRLSTDSGPMTDWIHLESQDGHVSHDLQAVLTNTDSLQQDQSYTIEVQSGDLTNTLEFRHHE